MTTSPNHPSQDLSACPFCDREFRRLGNHLPKCKERDYSVYLSKKTLDKKAKKGSSRRYCPKCHKQFLRLDSHLKRSPYCKSIDCSTDLPSSVGLTAAPHHLNQTSSNCSITPPRPVSKHCSPQLVSLQLHTT